MMVDRLFSAMAVLTLLSVALSSCAQGTPEQQEGSACSVDIDSTRTGSEVAAPSLGRSGEETPEPGKEALHTLTLTTPYIFSSYTFTDEYPQHEGKTLVLEMTQGEYDRSLSFWSGVWNGSFQFRYTGDFAPYEPFPEEHPEDVVSCPLVLHFNDPFELSIADYNQDGKPEFALSQYGSLSGGDYGAVFMVLDNGTVELLPIRTPVQRGVSMFGTVTQSEPEEDTISGSFLFPFQHCDDSPFLKQNGENGFNVSYTARHGLGIAFLFTEQDYDDWFVDHGGAYAGFVVVRDVYQWQEDAFALARQEILEDDGSVWRSSDG